MCIMSRGVEIEIKITNIILKVKIIAIKFNVTAGAMELEAVNILNGRHEYVYSY